MNCTGPLAAGVKAVPDGKKAASHAQAMGRFLANPRVTPEGLSVPLLAATREAVTADGGEYVLAVADWSRVNDGGHASKRDRLQMTHATDVGDELQSSLLVSAEDGAPLGVPVQDLVTAQGVWSSCADTISPKVSSPLDELSERMSWLEQQKFGPRLVHVIDREADSVGHLRRWTRDGQLWLVRAKGNSTVRYGNGSMRIDAVAKQLGYTRERQVLCQGRPIQHWIASAPVVLTRPAKPKKIGADGRRQRPVPGEPLKARLVVSRLCDEAGKPVAEWFLLTSVPETVSAARVALWYDFRWQIESFFKLLKQAGHQLEQWEQESGGALFKRLLIATQACILVWRLSAQQTEEAQAARQFLVRLSGRQMKASRLVTPSALLAGAFILFAILDSLDHSSIPELRAFANSILLANGGDG